ncbi:MAG: prolipoprotein diacylglyceryl transferase [Spirochaetes bacterium]|jgi:phosphatidylglycerol:prolipoprotein diacylglycerol transferase|nr:prolipoprotein diacylglyceryl transferase [Spirochaetota bacterium]
MYPIIFSYKMLTIGGYGIMLGLGFYLGFLLGEREFKLRGKDPELAYKILLAVIPSAIIGAKIFHVFENMEEFLRDPSGMIFSGAGLSVYGGFIFSFIAAVVVIRINKEDFLEVFDVASPTMAIGYAIGRFGCHVAGDGCYGIPTASFLGIAYPNGIVPTTGEVFPTALFESMLSFIFFAALMQIRKRDLPAGMLFFIYLIMNGMARFMVEFIRINPKAALGLTHAQFIAVLFVITGIIGIVMLRRAGTGDRSA